MNGHTTVTEAPDFNGEVLQTDRGQRARQHLRRLA